MPQNRLADEQSPYLRQHADNPVDWYPWGDEAFARARAEDRPIFLSVGYSTCHWCHVMERESFSDPEIAERMNALFVNVKVDREERPDIDRVYMAYVQAASGHGGWPMSVWLTPELEPFFAGTYFPPRDHPAGHVGFATAIDELGAAWQRDRAAVAGTAERAVQALRQGLTTPERPRPLDAALLRRAYDAFAADYDERHGGFGRAPKFPRPVALDFLRAYHERTGEQRAAQLVRFTLRQMAAGGIYDHLGGGFHRYSVDRAWHVPHFEKMLYDQAQLLASYVDGFLRDGDADLARVARETADYVLRDLTDAATGAFHSAEDADSLPAPDAERKAEGAFYVWRAQEIDALLGADAPLFRRRYGVRDAGNAVDPHGELRGLNVLDARLAGEAGQPRDDRTAAATLARCRATLLARRDERPRPHRDDKVLCGWNGMMIGALARAGAALGEPRYLAAAERAARTVRARLYDPQRGQLWRRFRAGEAAVPAFLEDHAQLVEGLCELYQATFALEWLQWAEQLAERQIELFGDAEAGGFFSTRADAEGVLLRLKEDYDGAEPSGNATSVRNLLRLAELCGRPRWRELAEETLAAFSARMARAPQVMPLMLVGLDLALHGVERLVIAGEADEPATRELVDVARRAPRPGRRVLIVADAAYRAAFGDRLPELAAMAPQGGRAAAYLCRGQSCQPPVSDPEALRELLARQDP